MKMAEKSETGIEALYPAVIDCFAVILLGFAAGKFGLFSTLETKGINTFIGTFSLPALVFVSIARLDLTSVNWPLILGISLGKTVIFVAVLLISLLVSRKCDKSGLFAIFCSQSNDFALGYPIVLALYGKEYADYLYLLGPVSLVILNPIGFVFMEISKQQNLEVQDEILEGSSSRSSPGVVSSLWVVKNVVVGVMKNPVVLMTALGVVANFVFHHHLPQVLAGILDMLGSAFSSAALFSLGLTMVRGAACLKGSGFVVPGVLIAVKLIALPLVSREFVNLLNPGILPNETLAMSNYAFLYGSLPTAPGVFVFACQYDIYVEMIAASMVVCTFLSAPLMFLAAKMISLRELDPEDYIPQFDNFLTDISIIGLISSAWVIGIFIFGRKWKSVPHCITLCLTISQTIACIGALIWCIFGIELYGTPGLYVQFGIFSFGVLSTRLWTAILASSLVFLRCRSLCFVLRMRLWMAVLGWGLPLGFTAILLSSVNSEMLDEKQNPLFQYGRSQAIVTLAVLVVSFIVTVGCLVIQHRHERKYGQSRVVMTASSSHQPQLSPVGEENEDDEENLLREPTNNLPNRSQAALGHGVEGNRKLLNADNKSSRVGCSSINCGSCPKVGHCNTKGIGPRDIDASEIEDLINQSDDEDNDDNQSLLSHSGDMCSPSKHACDATQRRHCRMLLERYRTLNHSRGPEEIGILPDPDDEFQILRHIILLLCLSISMFVGIALCFWTLVMEELSGIYVELIFLDAALNFGQGFLVFMLFGLDTRMVMIPLRRWWRRFAFGEGSLHLPKWEDLPLDTKHTCEQFLTYHFDKCAMDIVRDRRWRMESYSKVFCGHELVDWLILVGLAQDRSEGIRYGRHLLNGRVIRHVKELHHFYDQSYFYTFLPSSSVDSVGSLGRD